MLNIPLQNNIKIPVQNSFPIMKYYSAEACFYSQNEKHWWMIELLFGLENIYNIKYIYIYIESITYRPINHDKTIFVMHYSFLKPNNDGVLIAYIQYCPLCIMHESFILQDCSNKRGFFNIHHIWHTLMYHDSVTLLITKVTWNNLHKCTVYTILIEIVCLQGLGLVHSSNPIAQGTLIPGLRTE